MFPPVVLLTAFDTQVKGHAPPTGVLVMFIWRRGTLVAFINDTECPVVRLSVPPEPSRSKKPPVCEPSPETIKAPVVPLRIIPLVALFEAPLLTVTLRK